MAFEELDARVIGSSITVRLDGIAPGVSARTPTEPRIPETAAAPLAGSTTRPVPMASAATGGTVRPAAGPPVEPVAQRVAETPSVTMPQKKLRSFFVMKPLNAERLRTVWAVGAILFVLLVAVDGVWHGGWKALQGILPAPHVATKTVVPAAVQAAPSHVTQSEPAGIVAPVSAVKAQPTQVQSAAPTAQSVPAPKVESAQVSTPAPAAAAVAPTASMTAIAVQPQPVKTVSVDPVPAAVMASAAPVPPLPAAALPIHRRVRSEEAPQREVRVKHEEAPQEQNSPILVGGQYSSKATDSKGSDSK